MYNYKLYEQKFSLKNNKMNYNNNVNYKIIKYENQNKNYMNKII